MNSEIDGTEMLINRLRKNQRVIGKWARQQQIECYRLYDRDLPEYAFAIDCYGRHVQMAEYQAPASIEEVKVAARREQAIAAVQEVLGLARENIVLKSRERQRGKQQYEAQDQSASFFKVSEGPARFWINLHDYLDTGLFLDHRPIRQFIRENAAGKRFLNLFCYTASASVHAALGGARDTLSIDLSNTYLDWARRNFLLNKIGGKNHRLKKADCIEYLSSKYEKFDLIFLDPPTFSNSKSTSNVLDIQRDHCTLIDNAMNKLERGGLLIFSTNKLNFKLESESLNRYEIRDYTSSSLGKDFQRQKKIHQTWLVSHS
ncbi:MAG: bifunctional 23S rRNA (guanine(2069)-N(7))-methyltransferase RlmK/23S rRNA (guanine(2445)-N(2))-methyltransferase RlmL [Pseudohongiellaceae bacterium]